MIVALAVPVIFMFVAGAIDFSRVIALRGELQDAADVASVGSVAINSTAYKIGQTMGSGEIPDGEVQAVRIFYSDMKTHPELNAVTPKAKVIKTGTLITSSVTVTANYKPYMLGLFGFSTLPISATSKSLVSMPPFIDFYLLLDNSPSMGLGATMADIDMLVSATTNAPNEKKCAFACHETGPFNGVTPTSPERYGLAKKLGVTLRIDVVREATEDLMVTAKGTQTMTDQYRMAIYDFGGAADKIDLQNPVARQISPLMSNLDQSAKNAKTLELMTVPYQNYNSDRQTNFKSTLTSMNKIIPAVGDGLTATNPQKVLFFVSDGVNDGYDCASAGCRRIAPIDPAQCTTMKSRGVRIAVLYTTYLPLEGKYFNQFYKDNMAKYVTPTSQLSSQMQACASPGLFFEVGPNQGISEAMTALFNKVVSVVRINS